jgi:hypothetical protein
MDTDTLPALTDLGWIWRHVGETPNLFFDISWCGPSHLMALFQLVPPGRILNASDVPYCTPLTCDKEVPPKAGSHSAWEKIP